MNQPIKCLDCGSEFEITYECCQDLTNTPLQTDEDIIKKIKEIEELVLLPYNLIHFIYLLQTNFQVKKNICVDCLVKLTRDKDNRNTQMLNEIDNMKKALLNLTSEIESKDFSNYKYNKFFILINPIS